MRTTTNFPALRTPLLALAAIPVLVLSLASCAQDNSDRSESKDAPSMSESEKKAAAHEFDLAVAKCVRGKGFDMSDPNADGTRQGIGLEDGVDVQAVMNAQQECTASTQEALGKRPTTESDKKANETMEKKAEEQAACLRDKGYGSSVSDDSMSSSSDGGLSVARGGSDIPDEVLEACGGFGSGSGAPSISQAG